MAIRSPLPIEPAVQEDLVFDFGLHRGEDTAFYLAKGYRVVAFEADPVSIEFCRKRFQKELTNQQLVIVEGAIAENPEVATVPFYVNRSKPVWSTSNADWVKRNQRWGMEVTKVLARTVDVHKIFIEFGIPYYLKMDIEGVERGVLRVLKSLENRPRYLSFESEKVTFDELLNDLELLETLGYTRFKVVQQATIPGRRILTIDRSGEELSFRFEKHASGGFGEDAEGTWLTKQQTIDAYRKIFARYRLLGDRSTLGRSLATPLRVIRRMTGLPLPGWHDLHATLQ
jgi:FkbM family methyltransferase